MNPHLKKLLITALLLVGSSAQSFSTSIVLQCRVDYICLYGGHNSITQSSITDTSVFVVKSLQNEIYPVVAFDLVITDGGSVHIFEGINKLTKPEVAAIKKYSDPIFFLNKVTLVKDGKRISFHPNMKTSK
jgi:hypothetical protein